MMCFAGCSSSTLLVLVLPCLNGDIPITKHHQSLRGPSNPTVAFQFKVFLKRDSGSSYLWFAPAGTGNRPARRLPPRTGSTLSIYFREASHGVYLLPSERNGCFSFYWNAFLPCWFSLKFSFWKAWRGCWRESKMLPDPGLAGNVFLAEQKSLASDALFSLNINTSAVPDPTFVS